MYIQKKLPLFMLTLVCIPLILLSVWIYKYNSSVMIHNGKQQIAQMTEIQKENLSSLIQIQERETYLMSQRAEIVSFISEYETVRSSETKKKISSEMDRLLSHRKYELSEIQHSFIIDIQGNIISDTDRRGKGINVADREYFHTALEGRMVVSATLHSKIGGELITVFASPIYNKVGKIIGIYGNAVYTSYFEKFVKEIQVGQTGKAFIVDNQDMILAHANQGLVGLQIQNQSLLSILKGANNSTDSKVRLTTFDDHNTDKIMGYVEVPDTDWKLCITQELNELYLPSQQQLKFILLVLGVTLLFATMLSILFTKNISRPIRNLMERMGRAEIGDLNVVSSYQSNDEFGLLSKSFNTMIYRLRESYEELTAVYEEQAATEDELRLKLNQLMNSQEALALSEERFRQALNGVNDVVWEWDVDHNEFFVSEKWRELTGDSKEQVSIHRVLIELVDAKNRKKLEHAFYKVMKNPSQGLRVEIQIRTYEEELKWLLVRGNVILDKRYKWGKVTGAITDITTVKEAEQKIRQLAYFDPLTGLKNRASFTRDLEQEILLATLMGKKGAVLFVDADDFKTINDTLGHNVGDLVLQQISARLRANVEDKDFVCRFGGDEFVVLLKEVEHEEEVEKIASQIVQQFRSPFLVEGKQLYITCSIGMCMYPDHGLRGDGILRHADTAMYKAKGTGKNKCVWYTASMSQNLERSVVVERALRTAMEQDNLYLQYQPLVDIDSGKVLGYEALLRLITPELGFVSPVEFIPIAEKTGLIIPIGQWVMRKALEQLKTWRQQGFMLEFMSVNVSSVQMKQEDFIQSIKKIIVEAGVDPGSLKIEITESVFMESTEENIEILQQLHDDGIKLALDDFGTGYSSLNYLRWIPLDSLKIDKSFIESLYEGSQQEAIVDAIIRIAHILGIEVVVEGVELPEQVRILRNRGCDMIQGYLMSKPKSVQDIEVPDMIYRLDQAQ